MHEQLLSTGDTFSEDTGTTIFLYDPETNSDLMATEPTIVFTGTPTVSNELLGGHKAMAFPTGRHGILATFKTPLNLQGLDWTLEWSFKHSAITADVYLSEVNLISATGGQGIKSRWTDRGFGNRLQMGGNFSSAVTCWNPPIGKTGSINVETHMALSCKNGQVRIFRNGIHQMLANGAGSVYNTVSFAPGVSLANLVSLSIGSTTGSGAADSTSPGIRGRVRLSLGARYTRNYTVTPLEID